MEERRRVLAGLLRRSMVCQELQLPAPEQLMSAAAAVG